MKRLVMSLKGAVKGSIHLPHIFASLFLFSLIGGMLGQQAAAQATSGITGVVVDASGAILPGADVKLTNAHTAFSSATKTNDVGVYQFSNVPPATGYVLSVTRAQFRTASYSNLSLGVGVTETRNVKMEVGNVSEVVEVTAAGEGTVNTIDASIGNVITAKQVADLPSLFRADASNLLQLQPGVQAPPGGSDAQYGSVTGSRADAGNITLDGLDVNDETIGQAFTTVGRAPIDSIAEVRTIVGQADASYGRSGGAQVDLVTKSGTNQWHGSASEFNRVSVMAANDFFNNLYGIPKGQLTRNQFGGSIGGPIIKNKLFFFFDYLGRRDAIGGTQNIAVPLDPFRNGGLSYINNGPGCTAAATIASQPGCITTLTSGQVAALDPCSDPSVCPTPGANQALLDFIDSRYPEAQPNNNSVGDGVNTGGFAFTSPSYVHQNTYVTRLDFKPSSNHNLFARGTVDRDNSTQTPRAFPQDPATLTSIINQSVTWVAGDTWLINPNMTNQSSFGMSRQVYDFPTSFAPSAPNLFGFTSALSSPYGDFRGQSRNVPVPEFRDTFSWSRGKHTFQFGADIKPIRVHSTNVNDINFPTVGLSSLITNLNSTLRPGDILNDPSARAQWDNNFTTLLGRYASMTSQYNYDVDGNPVPQNSPAVRDFHYNEYEFYAQDTWHARSDLTFTYGLRWNYHGVPFEANGFQSVPTVFAQQLFDIRQQNALNGINGPDAVPFVNYVLGGPANKGPNYYGSDWKDFSPRLGIAYSPSFTQGFLGKVFGDRKTSIRAGAGLSYDRVLSTLSFEIDEVSQLFASSFTQQYGVSNDPRASLQTDPRFTSITSPPPLPPAGTIPRPAVTPYVDTEANVGCFFPTAGGLCATGLEDFGTLFQLNNPLKTPYALTVSFGVQRELPGNLMFEVDYFGKFAHRLIAVGDPAQQTNFKDPASGQFLKDAFGNIQRALQSGGFPDDQPWFENQMGQALGASCEDVFGASCTTFLASVIPDPFIVGDLSTVDLELATAGLILPNTGLDSQAGTVANVGNFGISSYNSLIVTLRKRFSRNLQFDINYAYAHSIDNVSDITNDAIGWSYNGQGLICDLSNLRLCRASSNFDATHTISANYIYQLPIGRGQSVLGDSPRWADALIGGWETSGIVSFHTGYPWNTTASSFPIDFTQEAPAVFVGSSSDVKRKIHVENGQVQFFADQNSALNAFNYPFGGNTGDRNVLRGPRYINVDMAVLKNFKMPWSDNHILQFRAEAFNVFNHSNFNDPTSDPGLYGSYNFSSNSISNPSQYGVLTNLAHDNRQLQLGLQYTF